MNTWKYCCDLFDYLPLAALIEGRIFCVSSGISPDLPYIDHIQLLDRNRELPIEGPIADLIYSDPRGENVTWFETSPRGAGYLFGHMASARFNRLNGLELIARSNQTCMDGFERWHDGQVITIFSAPNFKYRVGNSAAVLNISSSLKQQIHTYTSNRP
eukprot:CAMPEP_0185589510 /NCGR_PEP_ID=MMETSP0434-20130131/57338_1 /TAXON_ID=626734 ORGANISM="Favella taraikaensis, Strain Fe Narragansett Bay" /NCGR_SAMPLE_ID=MMETSP0434 /ASSEMBLY_ACC=CAM_ASM_000379 /LENGTH=157 /DNA_ID=CAMNT_0028212953 /DNA_START=354 /DNA_END=823 /DNA_ORIENTATION=-